MKAMVGYGIVVLMLAAGMMLSVHYVDVVAMGDVDRIRTGENQVTHAESLRGASEAIASTRRGYMISGDAAFLLRLEHDRSIFDRAIRALTWGAWDPRTRSLTLEVENDANALRVTQDLLVASARSDDSRPLARRFETELLPLRHQLRASLDRLNEYEATTTNEVYQRVADEYARLRWWSNALLSVLVVVSLGIAAYITSALRRRYQKEHEALETSQGAVAARDEIMGVVAHDLRNPLSAIRMRAALLRESAESPSTRKHAEGIERVTQHMESLIKSMLDAATIESGHFTVTLAPCDVSGLIDSTFELCSGLAAQKQIRLERSRNPPEAIVRADREAVLRVLENLVGNAIKFTNQGGCVIVAIERDRDVVTFRVSDTGPGIASEHLPCVFDRFWKHDVGGKKGTGLGLFIAKAIVEAHGGQIWVANGLPHGATFYFTLPILAETRPDRTAPVGPCARELFSDGTRRAQRLASLPQGTSGSSSSK